MSFLDRPQVLQTDGLRGGFGDVTLGGARSELSSDASLESRGD